MTICNCKQYAGREFRPASKPTARTFKGQIWETTTPKDWQNWIDQLAIDGVSVETIPYFPKLMSDWNADKVATLYLLWQHTPAVVHKFVGKC